VYVLRACLTDPDQSKRHHLIFEALARHDDFGKLMGAINDLLGDPDSEVRCEMAYGLEQFTAAAKAAAPTLRLLLDDPSKDVQVAAAYALQSIERANEINGEK